MGVPTRPEIGVDSVCPPTEGSILVEDTGAAAIVIDLKAANLVGKWFSIEAKTEEIGWFCRAGASTTEPDPTDTTTAARCARLSPDVERHYYADPSYPELVVVTVTGNAGKVIVCRAQHTPG